MFIEYQPGTKHTGPIKDAEISEDINAFSDCGQLIEENEVVIDIDHVPVEILKAMIKEFNITTETVWTDRGVHLWFKKPAWFTKKADGICRLAFEIEQHTKPSNPGGMTVKRNGIARKVDYPNARQYMPEIFIVGTRKNPYQNLLGMEEGDGRNKGLFAHRKALNGCNNWEKILSFINRNVFAVPMSDDEFEGICREISEDSDISDKYFIASHVISELRTIKYSGLLWWYDGEEYISDPGDDRLIRRVYQLCEGKDSRFVDEVIKQAKYRSPLIKSETAFPIRFKNGVLIKGRFIPDSKYLEFTPFFINIDYDPAADPVQCVDDYIGNLTDHDENYRKLLLEVIGYVMVTDPERIRSLGKFFMFRGDGANGKGTLLQIMKTIYNAKNCTNLSIKQLVDDKFKITMVGKLANLGDDIEAESIDEAQMKVLKNISTADTVSSRHMYAEAESMTYTVKLYFTTNSDIRSFEKGYAYKRRVVWLPMYNKVERPDPNFISKLTTQEALRYWIRLIVEGYQRLYENQKWTEAQKVKDYNSQYHEDNDVCYQFAKDLDPDDEIVGKTISEMKDSFFEWRSDDRNFSSKLFKDACWNLYQIGLGRSKVSGKTRRVFMRQTDTDQELHN